MARGYRPTQSASFARWYAHEQALPPCGICAALALLRMFPDTAEAAELTKPRYQQSRCMVGAVPADVHWHYASALRKPSGPVSPRPQGVNLG